MTLSISLCFLYKQMYFTDRSSAHRLKCPDVRTKPLSSKSTWRATPFFASIQTRPFRSKSLSLNSAAKVCSLSFPLRIKSKGLILVENLPSTEVFGHWAKLEAKVSPFTKRFLSPTIQASDITFSLRMERSGWMSLILDVCG